MDAAKPTTTLKLVKRSVLYNFNKITGDKPILTIYPVGGWVGEWVSE